MELVNEWFPTGKFRKVNTTFRTDYTYEKGFMAAVPLIVSALNKAEMEYNGKFGNTIGRINHIALMSRIEIFYTDCCLATQIVSPTLHGFQGPKRCIQYLAIHPHKPIFYPSKFYDVSNFIRLTWSGNEL